ncbi:MAG: hypothetical protein R2818_08470 [Flavobacteriales bacterium]
MEQPSGPERFSPEDIKPTFVRPPGLEFAMGVALFAMVLMVFFLIRAGSSSVACSIVPPN